jgi:hypothetical protein
MGSLIIALAVMTSVIAHPSTHKAHKKADKTSSQQVEVYHLKDKKGRRVTLQCISDRSQKNTTVCFQ